MGFYFLIKNLVVSKREEVYMGDLGNNNPKKIINLSILTRL